MVIFYFEAEKPENKKCLKYRSLHEFTNCKLYTKNDSVIVWSPFDPLVPHHAWPHPGSHAGSALVRRGASVHAFPEALGYIWQKGRP